MKKHKSGDTPCDFRIANIASTPNKLLKLSKGQSVSLNLAGPGLVREMWFCLTPYGMAAEKAIKLLENNRAFYRNVHITIRCDGMEHHLVNVPFADFFLFGHGFVENIQNEYFDVLTVPPLENPPRQGSFNCRIPMPFQSTYSITITNRNDAASLIEANIYWQATARHTEPIAYFAAAFTEQTCRQEPFVFTDLKETAGSFWGIGFNAENDDPENRWHEAPFHFIVDGNADKEIMNTGGEPFFGSCWGFRQTANRRYFGTTYAGHKGKALLPDGRWNPSGSFSAYRFLPEMPVRFNKSLRGWIGKSGEYRYPPREISGRFRAVSYMTLYAGDKASRS